MRDIADRLDNVYLNFSDRVRRTQNDRIHVQLLLQKDSKLWQIRRNVVIGIEALYMCFKVCNR